MSKKIRSAKANLDEISSDIDKILPPKKSPKKEDEPKEVMTPRTKKRVDLDYQIKNAGLLPMEKIVISDVNEGSSVRYMKAETFLGEPILIDVDVQGLVATRPEDLKVTQETDIPEDFQNEIDLCKVYNSTGMEFQGVSMECKNGVCVVSRDDKMKPVRTFLKKIEDNLDDEDNKSFLDMANVLPIVRFSDIVQNGNLIQKDISQTFKNLRNILYIDEKQKLADTEKYLEELHINFQESVDLIKFASEDLEETIQELTEYAEIYQESGMEDVEEQKKYRMVIANLKIRNEKVLELIGVLRTFNKMHPIVKKLNEKVANVKKTLEADFQELNQNLSISS
jgi:hypothetical protein